jgi:ATP-binding cassette subfamily B protein
MPSVYQPRSQKQQAAFQFVISCTKERFDNLTRNDASVILCYRGSPKQDMPSKILFTKSRQVKTVEDPLQRIEAQCRFLVEYLRPLWARVLVLAALLLLGIGLQLLNPQVIRFFIDTTQVGGPPGALLTAALAYLVIGLAGRAAALATTYVGTDVGWKATNQLRGNLVLHCLRLDMPFHKAHTPGELIERIDGDSTLLANFLSQLAIRVLGNGILILGILILLYRENPSAGTALTIFVLVTAGVLVFMQNLGIGRWAAARAAWTALAGFLEERIGGTEDIQGVGAEAYTLGQWDNVLQELLVRARSGWMATALSFVSTNFLYILGYGLGLAIGAYLYVTGSVTIGTAFIVVYYIGMLAEPLDAIRVQSDDLQQASAAFGRITELFQTRAEVEETRGTVRGVSAGALALEFQDVSFAYRDSVEPIQDNPETASGLRDLVLRLPAGHVLGILGRTGSGKTTVARLLFRLYDPASGTIRLGGADIREIPFTELRERVGLVTQDVQLFGASLRDNIAFFDRGISDDQIMQALTGLELLDWVQAMPDGIRTRLGAEGAGMSAGEAQLLAFTRLFLRDPGLLVLDEATSRLDPITQEQVERAVERLLRGRSAVIIAHRLRTVLRADDILILDGGRVVEFGPRERLLADPNSRFSGLLSAGLEEELA